MIDWGITAETIEAALGPVRPGVLAEFDRDEVFARVIWGVIIEPGDGAAGLLIDAVGAVAAARAVIDRVDPAGIEALTAGALAAEKADDALKRWTERLRAADVLRSLEGAARCHATLVVPDDADWPTGLAGLDEHRPVLLWARGDRSLLRRPGIAVVGARAATGYGEHVAMELAAGLAGRDAVVISGGAYGIDGMAHRAALASGGATIAILAGGIDRFYPSGHEALLTRIVEQGLLLSEVPCGTPPTRWRFLQRNRLIAAIAAATVVVEAGRRSGSLNTANHAADLGRPLGAVPGPVTSAASAGCHLLIREADAQCVTTVADVMQLAFGSDGVLDIENLHDAAIDPAPRVSGESTAGDADSSEGFREDPMQTRVVDALRPRRGQDLHEVARAAGEGVDRVRSTLGVLSLDGRAFRGDDGLWRRAEAVRRP